MPPIIPFIPLIAAGITAGTSIGLTLSNEPSGPTQPPIPKTPPPPAAQTPAVNKAQLDAVSQSIPNYISNTSGFASPGYLEEMTGTQTGLGTNPQAAGNLQSAIQQYFGLTAPGQTGFAGATSNPVTNTLQNLPGVPGVTGPSLTGGGGGLVDNLLQSQDFKGFS